MEAGFYKELRELDGQLVWQIRVFGRWEGTENRVN